MFRKLILITLLPFVVFVFASCGKDKQSNLKEIQTKHSGNYNIILLNESGTLKQGSNVFYLEFRNTSDNQLADAGKVSTNAVMQMSGMPMTGETTIKGTDTPGRYEIKGNFSMSGKWILNVEFGKGETAQFQLTVL